MLDLKINISSKIRLRYCPFCGRTLAELIQGSRTAFEKLADDHAKFRTVHV